MDQLPRLGKRELICLLLFTCNYVVSVWRGFHFLWVLGMGYIILLWHSLSLHIIIFHMMRQICVRHLLQQKNNKYIHRTIGPVNAHLISGPSKSTKHTKPGKKQGQEMTLTINTQVLSFTELVVYIYKFSGHLLK